MSLLDDARRLAAKDVADLDCSCQFCAETVAPDNPEECFGVHEHTPHAPDCAWDSMPKILAVIEAAERVVEALDVDGPWLPETGHVMRCQVCKVDLRLAYHAKDCSYQVLMDALKGDAA